MVDDAPDAVDEYWRGVPGRLMVTGSAGIVGALLGVAFSTVRPLLWGVTIASLLVLR